MQLAKDTKKSENQGFVISHFVPTRDAKRRPPISSSEPIRNSKHHYQLAT
jgi:hypothetical protein